MSRPKMRAVPAEAGWNPSRVWRRVVLPAPFGPSRPMQRPEREALNPLRIGRFPRWTSRPWSSMTGSFDTVVFLQSLDTSLIGRLLDCVLPLVDRPQHAAEAGQRAEVEPQGVLVAAREDDTVRLRV